MVIINTLNLKIPAMKRKSLLCLFLIISVAIHGNIYFKHLGKSDGLSQISVLSICQDELDRMWFGTLEGLNCYDGNQMKTYKPSPDNKDYFGGNEISHIVSDKQGNLFFTSDGKLIRYDLHKDRFLSLPLRTQTLFAHNHTIWTAVNDSVFHKATHIIAGDTEFLLDGKLLADSVLYLVHAVAESGHPHRSTAVPV